MQYDGNQSSSLKRMKEVRSLTKSSVLDGG